MLQLIACAFLIDAILAKANPTKGDVSVLSSFPATHPELASQFNILQSVFNAGPFNTSGNFRCSPFR